MEYQIGEFSLIVRLSVKTLRFYQEKGILLPSRIDPMTGYRCYDETSAVRAHAVRELKELGFSLDDIKEILSLCGEDEEIIPFLQRQREELSEKIKEFRAMERRIADFIRYQEEMKAMNVDKNITIKDLPEMKIASIRYRGRYDDVGKYIGPLMKQAGRHAAGGPFCLYHDPEYREDGADIELCVPIKQDVNRGGVTTRLLEGGRVVTIVHQGPYDAIGESYQRVTDYIKGIGAEWALPSREIYIKGPGMIFAGNPKKFLTEIQIPIKKA